MVKTSQQIKQMLADLYTTDGTIEQLILVYTNYSEYREAIDTFLSDINSRRIANGLDRVVID